MAPQDMVESASHGHEGVAAAAGVASTPLLRDLCVFLCAVLVGTTSGIAAQQALFHFISPQTASDVSLALATTCTGAAHSRLVHRKPIGYVLPSLVAGTPVAYGAMRVIHVLAGL
jgi:hypothetical protein